MKRLFLSLCIMSCMCFVAQAQGVTAESLVGEWRWVGKNVPELILVLEAGNKAPDSHGLKISSFYRYRIEDYQDPDCLFDGKTIHIRKDVGENAYIELDLRPQGEDLVGCCMMVGLLEKDFDDEICLRRNYFEYDIIPRIYIQHSVGTFQSDMAYLDGGCRVQDDGKRTLQGNP